MIFGLGTKSVKSVERISEATSISKRSQCQKTSQNDFKVYASSGSSPVSCA